VASIWCRNSVSASIMPARKAPSASDRPTAMSGPRRGQHREQHRQRKQFRGSHRGDHEKQRAAAASVRRPTPAAARVPRCRWRPKYAMCIEPKPRHRRQCRHQARNNGKLKSWNRQMATARRPCVRLFSDCSVSCAMMMAVEDMATAPPMITATAGAISNNEEGAGCDEGGGDQHLRAADTQHFPAHGHQARQREFQAQGEHQEHHAEVRQQLRGLVVRRGKGVRPQQHAHREIPQDRRQREFAHRRDHAHRGGEQNQDLQERIVMHGFLLA
jgi:hypothetical protein